MTLIPQKLQSTISTAKLEATKMPVSANDLGQQEASLLEVMDAIPGGEGIEFDAPERSQAINAARFDEVQ